MTAGDSNSPVFDFSSLDYQSINNDLTVYAQTVFPTALWTDFNSSNYGTHLLELMSYASDLLAYNANSQALETIVSTLTRIQNFQNIGKSFGYALHSATPSSTTETITLNPAGPGITYPFTISHHLQFGTMPINGQAVVFQPVVDTVVSSYGSGTVTVAIQNGQESYLENTGLTNGTQSQTFVLANPGVIDGTIQVSVGAQSYTLVSSFANQSPTATVFTTSVSEAGVVTLLFGDGVNGAVPPSNRTVLATYYYGGGSNTNVAAGTITQVIGTADGSAVPPQILSVVNTLASTGGADSQTVLSGQQNLPAVIKSNNRCVTAADYAAQAIALVSGVFAANATTGIYQGGSFPILLFIVPNGGGNPSNVLVNQILTAFIPLKLAGKRIRIYDTLYVNMLVTALAYIQPSSPALIVASTLQIALLALYAPTPDSFGAVFDLQSLYEDTSPAEIQGITRVYYQLFSIQPYWNTHVLQPVEGTGDVEGISTQVATGVNSSGTTTSTVPSSVSGMGGLVVSTLSDPQRREWFIQVIGPNTIAGVYCNQFTALQRQIGTVTSITDTALTDATANYPINALVTTNVPPYGWVLQPNPETSTPVFPPDGINTFQILSNSGNTFTVPVGLLVSVEPGDDYVVEAQEPMVGKILRRFVTTAVTSNVITVDSSPTGLGTQSFAGGDNIRIVSSGVETQTTIVSVNSAGPGTLTLAETVTVAVGATVDFLWCSSDGGALGVGSVRFSVVDGTTQFVPGSDTFYVDTYPIADDIELRPEAFPQVNSADFNVVPIGGVQ